MTSAALVPCIADTYKQDLFKGKVLFCTGGRSGICYAIVESMMSLGVSAAIVGRDAKGLDESAKNLQDSTGSKCIAAPADVRKPEQIKDAVKRTVDAYGKIDFVICGAAGNFLSPISGLSENAFRTVVEIDLLGTYHTLKATLPYLRESHGAYLHISATLHYRGVPFQAHVAAAKAGVDALSNVIAVEEGPWGVRSNIIAPGPILGTVGADKLSMKGKKFGKDIPLSRAGHVDDIANAAIYLFSPAAAWVSGSTLVVDGAENHIRSLKFPYPETLLEPEKFKDLVKPRL
ncbi:peroxisomal 2,4-dienoyl-CoA reductase [Cryptococcus wingfieldii CBS 7118]|uniref:2,4-dienoyl-CoA reductase [(3E)-enoyl-CoA-producing] n=1 Tax=Cryptococcus wingfieldii CBS 7118 TaxID=1295528 RepID=A0A1E3IU64_9TREE|nr:peroxisomal 2,4-dienoyl-CoA reductase [Cryptococcus wingfieldii CBS 7118]ODN92153.1 peroxisomal 2,4-dienoyl-CoA reductase [Cryptococcus wingfieldii CBS 7118]